MSLTTDSADRAVGLVFQDTARTDQPATHVLLVGVGQFADPTLAAVTSPPASIRALTAWWLDAALGRGPGFAHADCPLASVAVLLSEHVNGVLSELEGADVPRASFANVQQALRAWIVRAMANPNSTAVLVMSSHGQSFQRQTALLFEDYGSDALDARAGMTDVDQLVDALSTMQPANKLLAFDCCRLPVELRLVPGYTYGNALVGEALLPHGQLPRRPQVLRSTGLGAAALGPVDQPTLFVQALLDALRGCAADPGDRWRIRSSRIAETTGRIMELWHEDGARLQLPEFELSRAFPIATVPATQSVVVYIGLKPGHSMADHTIVVTQDGAVLSHVGAADASFVRVRVLELRPVRIRLADRQGGHIDELELTVVAPVAFHELPRAPEAAVEVTRTKSVLGSTPPMARVRIALQSSRTPGVALAQIRATVLPVPGTSGPARTEYILDGDGHDELPLEPGEWTIAMRRHGGVDIAQSVRVEDGDIVRLVLPESAAGKTWLAAAAAALVVPATSKPGGPSHHSGPQVALQLADGKDATSVALRSGPEDGRYFLYEPDDKQAQRFPPDWNGDSHVVPADQPVWATITDEGWQERAFLPVCGLNAVDWRVRLLVDVVGSNSRSHAAPFVECQRWNSLLALLAQRNFALGGAVLANLLARAHLREAVLDKVQNPLAALGAALITVATGQLDTLRIPEQWLRNLVRWFPGLPDGPVILARHERANGRPADDLLHEAFRRGTPVFSLAVDWLAEGLDQINHPKRTDARKWALATDPTRAFTVMREDPEAK